MPEKQTTEPKSSPPSPNDVPCKQCKQPIPADARLCVHCKSAQDWRGYLSASSTVLALLVALISVLTAAVPVATKALRSPVSKTTASKPVIEGAKARIVVTNRGEEPAMISDAYISATRIDPVEIVERFPVQSIQFRLTDASSGFIPKGNAQVVLEADPVRPRLNADQAAAAANYFYDEGYRWAMNAVTYDNLGMPTLKEAERNRQLPFDFYLLVIESDGKLQVIKHPLDWPDIGNILRAHAQRCSSLREPASIANGCLGHEDQPKKQQTS